VHLSDLHSNEKRSGWDASRILKTLQDDLKAIESDFGLQPDLFFFTGDAAFGQLSDKKGERLSDQFKEAQTFIEGVRTGFRSTIEMKNVFVVPGNHDINRWQVTEDQTEWLARQSNAYVIADRMRLKDLQWQRYMERLEEYKVFLKEAGLAHLLDDPDRLTFSLVRDFSGIRIGVAGLNSSWSCCRDGEKGKLWLGGNYQLSDVMTKLHDVDFRVCILHHPVNWFVEKEDPVIWRDIARDFSFCLHGHEHQNWVTPEADGHVRIAAGACYDRADRENGYCVVRVNFDDSTAEVWLRRFDSHGGCWVPRIVGGKTTNEGIWRIENVKGIPKPVPPGIASGSPTGPHTAPMSSLGGTVDLNTVIDLLRDDLAERLVQRATQLQDTGRFQDALYDFEKAIALGAKDPHIPMYLGALYASLGMADKGIEANQRALQAEPENFVASFNLAVSLFQAGRAPEEILVALDTAQRLAEKRRPEAVDMAKLRVYRGHTLQRLNQFQEAISEYREALSLLSATPRGRMFRGEAHKSLGDAFGHLGNKDEARKEYKLAIEAYGVAAFETRKREAEEALARLA
jgi:tetratricopeptide (TPR) repeat protein/predicted MPP superfamily phosphohydrolase